jgi:hypothetical protein
MENKAHSSSPDAIRQAIRREFAFLIDAYGFSEEPVFPPSDDIYAEVHFKKEEWRIAVLTTAHGTQVSMELVSPDGERFSFSYILDSKSAKLARTRFEPGLLGDIRCKAGCLQTYGSSLLRGSRHDFESAFEMMRSKHRRWIVESGLMSEAELSRFERNRDRE